ncbi:hypothetical protein HPB48_017232 [Haemaphysalis longicornis]|uniref:Uncharacterized protein n=1 Tax=Haemaphysalis longicornis TaxID=44386 RepID=A0A9J6H2X2_HAELO|nr:hypothetical protein HPB48_017232 [Haemaphysalis longicornis]
MHAELKVGRTCALEGQIRGIRKHHRLSRPALTPTQEVQTYVVIHHPPVVKVASAGALGAGGRLVGSAATTTSGVHQQVAAASASSSYGYQLHSETNHHHVPVLISTGHIPVLGRLPAHKAYVTVQHLHHAVHHHHHHRPLLFAPPHQPQVLPVRREQLSAQGSSFRRKPNAYVRLPAYPEYPGRNAALSLEEDTLAEAEAEPSFKVYKADAEYPPLNMRNRRETLLSRIHLHAGLPREQLPQALTALFWAVANDCRCRVYTRVYGVTLRHFARRRTLPGDT